MDINPVVSRFNFLQNCYRHCRPQDSPAYRLEFHHAHIELWHLAQVICAWAEPSLQVELDKIRRVLVAEIHKRHYIGPAVIHPITKRRTLRWDEYDLTPEIAHDPSVTGTLLPRVPVTRLRALHRAQRICVSAVLETFTGHFKP